MSLFRRAGAHRYFFWLGLLYVSLRDAYRINQLKMKSAYLYSIQGLNLALMCALVGYCTAAYFLP